MPGWTFTHTLATAAGAVATYAWLGASMVPETGPKTTADHIGTAVLVCAVSALFFVAFRRHVGQGPQPADG